MTVRVLGNIALAAAILAAPSCGGEANAILELEIALPPAPPGETIYVLTQARRADRFPFVGADWRAGEDPAPIRLETTATRDHISLETVGDDELDLNVRVRFCTDPGCAALSDDIERAPQAWFTLEHPFYLGHRTFFELSVPTIPTTPPDAEQPVERCAIRGCVDGVSTTYCRMDGSHLCE